MLRELMTKFSSKSCPRERIFFQTFITWQFADPTAPTDKNILFLIGRYLHYYFDVLQLHKREICKELVIQRAKRACPRRRSFSSKKRGNTGKAAGDDKNGKANVSRYPYTKSRL